MDLLELVMNEGKTTVVNSILDFLKKHTDQFAQRGALCVRKGEGWHELTYSQLSDSDKQLGSYLIEYGIKRGDRIALLSESKPEWGVAIFAGARSGATMVPLDIKLTSSELTNILSDCEPRIVFCDSKHKEVVETVKAQVKSIEKVVIIDPERTDANATYMEDLKPQKITSGVERSLDEVALFVYTSGTTGNPKGVMTTFGNLIFQVQSFRDMLDLSENDRFLSILPLNHLYELCGGFLGILNQGGMVCFCHTISPQEIMRVMREKQITGMIAVPLFYKSLKGTMEREVRKKGEDAQKQFAAAFQKAEALTMEQRAQLFAAVHEQLGGKLRVLICGGAPLEEEVAEFFNRLGFHLLQGYGLTETSPVITGNTVRKNRIGSVGPALPGIELKIDIKGDGDTEGEILTRGPHVMKGYYKRDEMTREVIDADGWFHTGDIGHIDKDGFLFITGRIKNLIVLGGGKKIFPEEVEAVMANAQTIKELCVLGRKSADGFKEGTEEVVAVVVPTDGVYAANLNKPEAVLQAIKKELDELGQNLAPYKRPSKIFIYDTELPKTPTRKVKRAVVQEWVKDRKN